MFEVLLKQKPVSKLLTFENNLKVTKFHEKLSRKRWQVINFLTPLLKIRVKTFWNPSFPNRFLHLTFETNISFQNSNTQN